MIKTILQEENHIILYVYPVDVCTVLPYPFVGIWQRISRSEDRRGNAGLPFGVVKAPAY
jgi:hypothetical protein